MAPLTNFLFPDAFNNLGGSLHRKLNNPSSPLSLPQSQSYVGMSRTARLESKIKDLEASIRHAEHAAQESAVVAQEWCNPILTGEQLVPRAKVELEPFIVSYPTPSRKLEDSIFTSYGFSFEGLCAPDGKHLTSAAAAGVESGFVSLVPRALVHQELEAWDQISELSVELRLRLWGLFLPYRDQFNFDVHYKSFEERLRLPHESSDSVHPCLINAIAVAACTVSGPDLAPYAQIFVERTRKAMDSSLANVEKLEHFLWSSVLMGWYYSRIGKLLPAHSMACTVAHMALCCGLNEISDPETYVASGAGGLLGPTKNVIHFAERVNLWWAVFLLDRRLGLASGLPPTIDDQSTSAKPVTTVWPRSCSQIRLNSSYSAWGHESITDLFTHGTKSTNVATGSLLCIRAKTAVLLDRAMWVNHMAQSPHPCDAYWSTYLSVDSAVTEVFRSMPELQDQRELHTAELNVNLNPSLVLARGYIQATLIFLHSIDADRKYDSMKERSDAQIAMDGSRKQLARDKTILAARLMAKDIRRIEDTSFLYSHACLGILWYSGAEVIAREIHRNTPPKSPEEAQRLRLAQTELDTFVFGLSKVTGYYPGLVVYLQRLSELVAPHCDASSIKVEECFLGEASNRMTSGFSLPLTPISDQ